ncbi:hypothetical protein Mgra_00002597 [Meloidogyne graminicola]|uniref:Kinetochore protein Nuf2 N-terminal domain-containing protein n=1 Tax=Meloidogyne graminicola TaxID=189291 RepID=A0A8S9ZY93_9BILA|nr:hypothetical protein Mgra_00002597 [Meloidogyne graminicola]
MVDVRLILEFFNREAPQLALTHESLEIPQTDQLIQAYNLLCCLLLDINCDLVDPNVEHLLARPNLIIKTRESVNLIFDSLYNGNDEFCYTDLLQPDSRRTRHFLSQLIRFYYFKCEIFTRVVNVENDIEDQCRTYKLEKDFALKTEENINIEKNRLNELEEQRRLAENEDLQLQKELAEKKALVASEKKNYEEFQGRLKDLQNKIEEQTNKCLKLEETIKRMDMNIVNSPERLIKELGTLEDSQKNGQITLEKIQQENRKLEYELAEILAIKKTMSILESDLEKLEKFQCQIPEMRGNKDKITQEINNLEREKMDLRNKLEQTGRGTLVERENIQEKIKVSRNEVEAINQKIKDLQWFLFYNMMKRKSIIVLLK